ncbi:MAG: hypothetical protein FIA95_11375, partial [Gemmatimonadetes bacterium]|nr:hypothetical protein [Gemmatimonadota bacterium]
MRGRTSRALAGLAVLSACALPPGTPGTSAPEPLPPPGFGTLREDDVTGYTEGTWSCTGGTATNT